MVRGGARWLGIAMLLATLGAGPTLAHEGHDVEEAGSGELALPPHVFDRMKALVGEWVAAEDGADGASFEKGDLVSRYALTGAGSALVDTLFPGKPYEMTTVYYRDGADLALTHFSASGNQPRMRAKAPAPGAGVLELAFDGGTNLDPARDSHMHSARIQLVGPDEIVGEWQGWERGKPDGAPRRLHLVRRK